MTQMGRRTHEIASSRRMGTRTAFKRGGRPRRLWLWRPAEAAAAVAGLPPRRLSLLRPAPAADNVRAASATSALRDGGLPPPTSYAGRGW